jgi:ethanolamine utilization protein EutA
LIYAHLDGAPWPTTTYFGDLGIDLTRALVASPRFAPHLRATRPASAGRATVYGLLRHSTEVSGATLFLPNPALLPLTDLPIFGSFDADASDERLGELLDLVQHAPRGGALQIVSRAHDAATARTLGTRLAAALHAQQFPPGRPLVLLLRANFGKVLGHYVTEWGALPLDVVIIDEVAVRDAQYVQIGASRGPVVPVSFYGLNEAGERP